MGKRGSEQTLEGLGRQRRHLNENKYMEITSQRNFRMPTLQSVLMVEKFIHEHSGEFRKTEIWKKLPKKMQWGVFKIIMEYLEDNCKIVKDKNGLFVYIWNPNLYNKIRGLPNF